MGTGKKEATRKLRTKVAGDGMQNVKVKGENFYRTGKQAKVLKIFTGGKEQRNAHGKITKAAAFQGREVPVARIEPNRKWFANSRVIGQDALASFRSAMEAQSADPYQVLLKSNKLPMTLIRDGEGKNGVKQHQAKIAVEASPFSDTFGPKAQRKRVKLGVSLFEDLAENSVQSYDTFLERQEQARLLSGNPEEHVDQAGEAAPEDHGYVSSAREAIFHKGKSRRIWNELYKVVDSSDVILHVLDARDPLGTRCLSVEKYMQEECPHKHHVFVICKIDLVPTKVAAAWVRWFSKFAPTIAFHASLTNSFGKGSLIQLLRQFSILHKDRKQISVGLVGYPNVGKSSLVNALRGKKVCVVAPIPGETKTWQYITLMKRIYLIDCPGIVPPNSTDTPQDILLKGVVRVENVENPEQYIPAVLAKTKPQHIERTYGLKGYKNHIEFLEALARKAGRLLHGGEPDVDGVAKMVINDFLRGKIPWFTPPPLLEEGEEEVKGVEGRMGKLGEMGLKRKREDAESTVADTEVNDTSMAEAEDEEGDEFEGFDSDGDLELSDDGMSDSDSEVEGGVELEEQDEEDDEDEDASSLAIEEQIRETLKSNPSTKDTVRIPTPKKRKTKT